MYCIVNKYNDIIKEQTRKSKNLNNLNNNKKKGKQLN